MKIKARDILGRDTLVLLIVSDQTEERDTRHNEGVGQLAS